MDVAEGTRVFAKSKLDLVGRRSAKLYLSRVPKTTVDVLYKRVLPFCEENGVDVDHLLTDDGREYCGRPFNHPFELFLTVSQIQHRRTDIGSPETNGFCERFHRSALPFGVMTGASVVGAKRRAVTNATSMIDPLIQPHRADRRAWVENTGDGSLQWSRVPPYAAPRRMQAWPAVWPSKRRRRDTPDFNRSRFERTSW
jgi:hypothetical protein